MQRPKARTNAKNAAGTGTFFPARHPRSSPFPAHTPFHPYQTNNSHASQKPPLAPAKKKSDLAYPCFSDCKKACLAKPSLPLSRNKPLEPGMRPTEPPHYRSGKRNRTYNRGLSPSDRKPSAKPPLHPCPSNFHAQTPASLGNRKAHRYRASAKSCQNPACIPASGNRAQPPISRPNPGIRPPKLFLSDRSCKAKTPFPENAHARP